MIDHKAHTSALIFGSFAVSLPALARSRRARPLRRQPTTMRLLARPRHLWHRCAWVGHGTQLLLGRSVLFPPGARLEGIARGRRARCEAASPAWANPSTLSCQATQGSVPRPAPRQMAGTLWCAGCRCRASGPTPATRGPHRPCVGRGQHVARPSLLHTHHANWLASSREHATVTDSFTAVTAWCSGCSCPASGPTPATRRPCRWRLGWRAHWEAACLPCTMPSTPSGRPLLLATRETA